MFQTNKYCDLRNLKYKTFARIRNYNHSSTLFFKRTLIYVDASFHSRNFGLPFKSNHEVGKYYYTYYYTSTSILYLKCIQVSQFWWTDQIIKTAGGWWVKIVLPRNNIMGKAFVLLLLYCYFIIYKFLVVFRKTILGIKPNFKRYP